MLTLGLALSRLERRLARPRVLLWATRLGPGGFDRRGRERHASCSLWLVPMWAGPGPRWVPWFHLGRIAGGHRHHCGSHQRSVACPVGPRGARRRRRCVSATSASSSWRQPCTQTIITAIGRWGSRMGIGRAARTCCAGMGRGRTHLPPSISSETRHPCSSIFRPGRSRAAPRTILTSAGTKAVPAVTGTNEAYIGGNLASNMSAGCV